MSLEYLLRVPTPIGTVNVAFENNATKLFTFLEANEEDKQGFKLLGLDPDKLDLIQRDIFDELTHTVINPASQVEFCDLKFSPPQIKFYSPRGDLTNIVADAYSSKALLNPKGLIDEYPSKIQELNNNIKDIIEYCRNRSYAFYGAIAASIGLLIGSFVHPSTASITSHVAAILIVSATIYNRRISKRADYLYDQIRRENTTVP